MIIIHFDFKITDALIIITPAHFNSANSLVIQLILESRSCSLTTNRNFTLPGSDISKTT